MIKVFNVRSVILNNSLKSVFRSTQRLLSIENQSLKADDSVDSTYPVIPKNKFLLPLLNRHPHPKWFEIIENGKQWLLSVANNSVVDESTKQGIESLFETEKIEAGPFCMIFTAAGHDDYPFIDELTRELIFLYTLDDFLANNISPETHQQICNYISESNEEGWTHEADKDHKRPFLLNLYGHSVLGWRRAGLTRHQENRLFRGFTKYMTMAMNEKSTTYDEEHEHRFTADNYLIDRGIDGFCDSMTVLKERMANLNMTDELRYHPDIVQLYQICDGLIVLTNDLASYFLEKQLKKHDLTYRCNYITIVKNEYHLNEQEAVNRSCEYLVQLYQMAGDKIKKIIHSDLCRENPKLELLCRFVLPTTVLGLCQSFDIQPRHRFDKKKKVGLTRDCKNWDDGEMFFNESDPNNKTIKFEWPIKSFGPDQHKKMELWL